MIKINKQLSRKDGSKISSGSILFNRRPSFDVVTREALFYCSLYITKSALDNGKDKIEGLEIPLNYSKACTTEEWNLIASSVNTFELVEGWLLEEVLKVVGVGNAEII